MAIAVRTIEYYIANVRKKDTIWMVFNTEYNKVHSLKQEPYTDEYGTASKYLNREYTNFDKQKEFLEFMNDNFPDTKIFPVMDLVTNYTLWPYLGSYVIDTDIGSDVYNALYSKYGNPSSEDEQVNAELWMMSYEDAKIFNDEHKKLTDSFIKNL
jgi:hypothetical protein